MLSPLRYPGGKAKLFPYFTNLFRRNCLYGRVYAEPYAGGAGLALKLLAHGYVSRIELNDIDPAIAAFWRSVLGNTDRLCSLIEAADLSTEEWRRQRFIYQKGYSAGELELGFSAYYLNRTSRSGIIEGSGPIGGYSQAGTWKIDARFNKQTQIGQIQEIARFRDCIRITDTDALEFLETRLGRSNTFVYLDPPYYVKGRKLYKNFYRHEDHARIANLLSERRDTEWVLSYDCVSDIIDLYGAFTPVIYSLQYSAGAIGLGREVIYAGDRLVLPAVSSIRRAA